MSTDMNATTELVFALDDDVPIPYMQRTRDYYLALGYNNPYRWAHFVEVPFTPLGKPLAVSRLALLTTAAPYQPEAGDQGPGASYNATAKFYRVYSGPVDTLPDLRIAHLGYDRVHTTTEDMNTYLPLARLQEAVAAGRIGALTPRFHGVPTNRSQRVTMDTDCPEVLRRCQEDGADAAIMVANWPVCHQTVSLAARHLEANGIPTVVMGCAKDIVEHCGVPRFLFSDFPLGNAAGKPGDVASQRTTLELALRVLESAPGPRTTVQSPLRWSADAAWKRDYCNIDNLSPEVLAQRRQEFDAQKVVAQTQRDES